MTRLAILAEIKTLLEAVSNIGIVHDAIRWTVDEGKWREDFVTEVAGQPQIRTWMIYRSGGGNTYGASNNALGTGLPLPTRSVLDRYDFKIEGWVSFAEGQESDSDTDFQALVDSVIDKFQDQISLNSSALTRGPISYNIDHMFFGNYFVHHIILEFWAAERTGITPA